MPEERKLPQHLFAESSVIGAMVNNEQACIDVFEILIKEDFYKKEHQAIFEAMRSLYDIGKNIDVITIAEELKRHEKLEFVGGSAYLQSLVASVPFVTNAVEYAKIVKEKAISRDLITASGKIAEICYKDTQNSESMLDYAEHEIFKISQLNQKGIVENIADVLEKNEREIELRLENKGSDNELKTGYLELDKMLGGLKKSDLIVLAARPSVGKTSFALGMMLGATKRENKTALLFSLEMPSEQIGFRMLSMESNVTMDVMLRGDMSDADHDVISSVKNEIANRNILIDSTPGITISEMRSKCRKIKHERGLDLVVVDYMQLMALDKNTESRQQEISEISRQLKQLAREMECPFVVLSQLSRLSERRTGHRPMLSDLRDSGAIEQDADVVLMLFRKDLYTDESDQEMGNEDNEVFSDPDEPKKVNIIIAKNRNGATGDVVMYWKPENMTFRDIEWSAV